MDYGCGLGTMMRYITYQYGAEVFGFDVNDYYEGDPFYFRKSIYFPVDTVYFMHSFAHIPHGPNLELIKDMMLSPGGKVVVLTPNKVWLDSQDKTKYTPDPTVFKHYTLEQLHQMFLESGLKITHSGEVGVYPKIGERLFIIGEK
jgi:2-polyprenyl-3-methyl-5-hydroxy-6-metoxy-1,4-benzoquinol methylase